MELMWIALGVLIGWSIAMWHADWRIRRSSMLDVHEKLDAMSLRLDLVVEGLENFIEPKDG